MTNPEPGPQLSGAQKWVGDIFASVLQPALLQFTDKLEDQLIPKIVATIDANMDKWLPKIMAAIVAAVTATMGKVAQNTGQEISDAIPGPVDDMIIKPIANAINDILRNSGQP